MTDKLLCPFCGRKLNYNKNYAEYRCWNFNCEQTNACVGSKNLWQALIDTKKKLDNEKQHEKIMAEAIQHHLETEQRLVQECMKFEKKLDIAVDALKSAKTRMELINNSKFANLNHVLQIQTQCEILKIDKALEQINQKD